MLARPLTASATFLRAIVDKQEHDPALTRPPRKQDYRSACLITVHEGQNKKAIPTTWEEKKQMYLQGAEVFFRLLQKEQGSSNNTSPEHPGFYIPSGNPPIPSGNPPIPSELDETGIAEEADPGSVDGDGSNSDSNDRDSNANDGIDSDANMSRVSDEDTDSGDSEAQSGSADHDYYVRRHQAAERHQREQEKLQQELRGGLFVEVGKSGKSHAHAVYGIQDSMTSVFRELRDVLRGSKKWSCEVHIVSVPSGKCSEYEILLDYCLSASAKKGLPDIDDKFINYNNKSSPVMIIKNNTSLLAKA